jgi:hypothetical protein
MLSYFTQHSVDLLVHFYCSNCFNFARFLPFLMFVDTMACILYMYMKWDNHVALNAYWWSCCQMGNSLEAYRAAIGLFHAHTRKSNRPINFSAYSYKDICLTNLRCSFLLAALLCLQSLSLNINAVFLLFVLTFILMVGNVEINPGPPRTKLLRFTKCHFRQNNFSL